MSLSTTELKEKISKIDEDIIKLRSEVGSERKIAVLNDYKEYLKDEVRMIERNRGNNG